MNAPTFRAFLFLLAIGASATEVVAVTYTATLLHPAGYYQSFVDAIDISGNTEVGRFRLSSASDLPHAALWAGTASSLIDLHQDTFRFTLALAVSGGIQGGAANVPAPGGTGVDHAVIWSGNAASVIDMHPAGFQSTVVFDVDGDTQVGYGQITTDTHALLWHGTAASKVDLNPAGFVWSFGFGISGNTEVGYARTTSTMLGVAHAMKWSGTAASAVDLNPSNIKNSIAWNVYGTKQVGMAGDSVSNDTSEHAMLWSGTAASAVDLHPAGFTSSEANATIEDFQVGYAVGADRIKHAILWNGTAASAVDLNPLFTALNPSFVGSVAMDIAANGSIVGNAYDANGNTYAVLLTVVPEPSTAVLVASIFALLACRRRR